MHIAETIRQQVEGSHLKRTDTGEPLDRVTVSIGYDCIRADDVPTSLMDRADKALYRAKQQGRNKVVPYED
jgi:diguanylate cyclase